MRKELTYQISWNFGNLDFWIGWPEIEIHASKSSAKKPNTDTKSMFNVQSHTPIVLHTLNGEHSSTLTSTHCVGIQNPTRRWNLTIEPRTEATKRQKHERLLIFNQKSILYGGILFVYVRSAVAYGWGGKLARYQMLCCAISTRATTCTTLPIYTRALSTLKSQVKRIFSMISVPCH